MLNGLTARRSVLFHLFIQGKPGEPGKPGKDPRVSSALVCFLLILTRTFPLCFSLWLKSNFYFVSAAYTWTEGKKK